MSSHAFLAPSASSRWLECTASPGFIAKLGDQVDRSSSVYAEEGTLAHELAEDALRLGVDASDLDASEEMQDFVQGYLDFVRELAGDSGEILVESKLPLFYAPESTGTVDCAIHHKDEKRLVIADLKYGMGVSVSADHNTQLAIYCASLIQAWELTDLETIEIYVYQPRVIGEGAVRGWKIGYGDFLNFVKTIEDIASKILRDPNHDDLRFKPSEKACRFCPAKSICSSHAAYLLDETPLELEVIEEKELTLPDVKTLNLDQLKGIYEHSSQIEKWFKSVAEHLFYLTDKGDDTGFKVVEGRAGNARWTDEEAAEKKLASKLKKDERTTSKIISPTQARKLIKKLDATDRWVQGVEELITRPSGKPVLAPEDDKRPALNIRPEDHLEALDD